jgi:hypothetical protein
MIAEYSFEYYSARHILNVVYDFRFDYLKVVLIVL